MPPGPTAPRGPSQPGTSPLHRGGNEGVPKSEPRSGIGFIAHVDPAGVVADPICGMHVTLDDEAITLVHDAKAEVGEVPHEG